VRHLQHEQGVVCEIPRAGPNQRDHRGRQIMKHVILLSIVVLLSVDLRAATYYVSPSGNDSKPGSSTEPFATIQKAANTMRAGDTTIIRGGTYGAFQIPYSGSSTGGYITYQAAPGERVIVTTSSGPSVLIQEANSYTNPIGYLIIDGLEIAGTGSDGLKGYNVHHSIFRRNIFRRNTNMGMLIIGSEFITVDRNLFDSNGMGSSTVVAGDHGMYITGNNWTVVNNIFYNAEGYGLQLNCYTQAEKSYIVTGFDNCQHWTIANNTFAWGRNRAAIVLYPGAGSGFINDIHIFNNIMYRNAETGQNAAGPNGVNIYSGVNIFIHHNLYYGNNPFVQGSALLSDNYNSDPMFVNSISDFRLQVSSAAIDRGIATGAPAIDFDGVSRPQGAGYDIGAYEFVVAGTNPTPSPTPIPTPVPTPSDTLAPTVSITSPADSETVSAKSSVTIIAVATDNVAVERVEFYVNGSLKCTDSVAPYSCNWSVPGGRNKSYSIEAKAHDAAGNVGPSPAVKVKSQ
jgi:hypothetical protein